MKSVSFREFILGAGLVCVSFALASCGGAPTASSLIGAYSSSDGGFALDLRAGGAATYTSVGATFPCTYTTAGDKLTLSCQGQSAKTEFVVHADGSLTAPQAGFIGTLRKTK